MFGYQGMLLTIQAVYIYVFSDGDDWKSLLSCTNNVTFAGPRRGLSEDVRGGRPVNIYGTEAMKQAGASGRSLAPNTVPPNDASLDFNTLMQASSEGRSVLRFGKQAAGAVGLMQR